MSIRLLRMRMILLLAALLFCELSGIAQDSTLPTPYILTTEEKRHPKPGQLIWDVDDPCAPDRAKMRSGDFIAGEEGEVVKVIDGGRLVIEFGDSQQRRVRLIGVEAPLRLRPYGKESRQHLTKLALGKRVLVFARDFNNQLDVVLAEVNINENGEVGANLNLEQLRAGLAQYENSMRGIGIANCRYQKAEDEAKSALRGFWRDRYIIP